MHSILGDGGSLVVYEIISTVHYITIVVVAGCFKVDL